MQFVKKNVEENYEEMPHRLPWHKLEKKSCWMGLESLKVKSHKASLSKLAIGEWYTIYEVTEIPEFMKEIF